MAPLAPSSQPHFTQVATSRLTSLLLIGVSSFTRVAYNLTTDFTLLNYPTPHSHLRLHSICRQLSLASFIMAPTTVTKGPTPGRGRNRWTHEQRTCLCLLFGGSFDIPTKDRATVFNTIFKDDLDSYGLLNGLELNTLQCQYHERTYRHKSSWSKTWEAACSEPATAEEHGLRDQMRAKIRAAVQSLQSGDTIEVAMPSTPVRSLLQQRTSQDLATPNPSPTSIRRNQRRVNLTPHATPGPSTQKRRATALDEPDIMDTDDEDDKEYFPAPKKRKPSPIVDIPPSPVSTKQVTKYRPSSRQGATMLWTRMAGGDIYLTPTEFAEAQQPLENVKEADAHPRLSPFLFRRWSSKSHGQ